MFLKAMIENHHYTRFQIIFRLTSIFYDMNMNRSVIIRVKFENESEYDKNSWHNSKRFTDNAN